MIDAIVEQVDCNGDGEIDFEEFQTLMCITASQPTKETLRAWTTRAKSMSHLGTGQAIGVSTRGLRGFVSMDECSVPFQKKGADLSIIEDLSSSFKTESSTSGYDDVANF